MNRRAIFFTVWTLALLSPSAFAYEEAVLSPEILRLQVGESAEIRVSIHHVSGLNTTMYGFRFFTTRREIAALDGRLDYVHPVRSGRIYVMALAPGIAQIMSDGKLYATVEVSCGFVQPVQAIVPVITAKPGQKVRLSATTSTEKVRVLQWYAGRIGDTSRPLAALSTDLEITPTGAGTQYVWVSANSPCSSSSAEFRIDVVSPRRRAAGR